jgi:hypothetical protein
VQHPCDLDIACTLALLQEEAHEPTRHKEFKKADHSPFAKLTSFWAALPLPPPQNKPAPPAMVDKKKPTEDNKNWPRVATVDDKLATLCAYRKAHGLYMYFA